MSRVRTGCLTCRARKIKCDDSGPFCNNCKRLGDDCIRSSNKNNSGSNPAFTPLEVIQAGLKRKRIAQSCTQCRNAKRKCSGGLPCERCVKLNFTCDFNEYESTASATQITTTSAVGELFRHATLRPLIEIFFADVYPLRCLGFIHKPTFMQNVVEADKQDPKMQVLLMAVCALSTTIDYKSNPAAWESGIAWAKVAQNSITANLNQISIHSLMVVVLLHEHEARVGNYASSFILSGIAARLLQALQINLEFDFDITCMESKMSPTDKELRRRLMWACFLQDSLICSGTSQLQLVDERDIKIQLPCHEGQFLFGQAVATELLEPGKVLEFIDADTLLCMPATNLGHRAYLIRIMSLRLAVLRHLKQHVEELPWDPSSRFAAIERDLRMWKASLPPELALNSNIIYIRKEQHVLSTLFFLHGLYHQCFCDLYRIIMPGLAFHDVPSNQFEIQAPPNYIPDLQRSCFEHACAMTDILKEALLHKSEALREPTSAILAHEAARIQALYVTRYTTDSERDTLVRQITPMIHTNVEYLSEMEQRFPTCSRLFVSMQRIIQKSGLPVNINFSNITTRSSSESVETILNQSPPQASPEYRMHPLSTFSNVRQVVSEKHAPETSKWIGSSSLSVDDTFISSTFTSDFEAWLMRDPIIDQPLSGLYTME